MWERGRGKVRIVFIIFSFRVNQSVREVEIQTYNCRAIGKTPKQPVNVVVRVQLCIIDILSRSFCALQLTFSFRFKSLTVLTFVQRGMMTIYLYISPAQTLRSVKILQHITISKCCGKFCVLCIRQPRDVWTINSVWHPY